MKEKYRDNIIIYYTDSLITSIETPDVYEDMKEMINEYDTYDYDNHNIYGLPRVNNKSYWISFKVLLN